MNIFKDIRISYLNTINEMPSVIFNTSRMEFLISFTSGDIAEDLVQSREGETLNLGQAQILMDISHKEEDSVIAIKILLPTPLSQEAMNAIKKTVEKSEIKITSSDKY